ncbi:MAG: hypothetical protein NUV46_01240 [Nanoarchaeota archaeon]|nr:hypothetical protein [Nanoarchaeota archaeon]
MNLRRAKIESPYSKELTNMELLTEGRDYSHLGFDSYVSGLKESISEKLNKEVKVTEKKLNPKIEKLVIGYYSGQ